MSSLGRAELVRELQELVRRKGNDAARGSLEALISGQPAPLQQDAGDMNVKFRAGLIAGRIYGQLLEERATIDTDLMLTAAVYAAALAQSAELGRFESASAKATLKQHTTACILVWRNGSQLPEDDELALYRWRTGELGVFLTDEALEAYKDMRAKRLRRLAEDSR
jgi:hypothetical protein